MSLKFYLTDNDFIKWLKVNYSKLMQDSDQLSADEIVKRLRSFGFSDRNIIGLGRAYHLGANDILEFNP